MQWVVSNKSKAAPNLLSLFSLSSQFLCSIDTVCKATKPVLFASVSCLALKLLDVDLTASLFVLGLQELHISNQRHKLEHKSTQFLNLYFKSHLCSCQTLPCNSLQTHADDMWYVWQNASITFGFTYALQYSEEIVANAFKTMLISTMFSLPYINGDNNFSSRVSRLRHRNT